MCRRQAPPPTAVLTCYSSLTLLSAQEIKGFIPRWLITLLGSWQEAKLSYRHISGLSILFAFSFQSLVSFKVPFYYKLNCASLLFTLGSYEVPVKDLCSGSVACLLIIRSRRTEYTRHSTYGLLSLKIHRREWGFSQFSESCHPKPQLCMPTTGNFCVCVPRGHHPRANVLASKTETLPSWAKRKQNTIPITL